MAFSVSIPGWGNLYIANVLFDLNGTLARDSIIAESTRERLQVLGEQLSLDVMSADLVLGHRDDALDTLIYPKRLVAALRGQGGNCEFFVIFPACSRSVIIRTRRTQLRSPANTLGLGLGEDDVSPVLVLA